MTSGGAAGGRADVLYIDVEARLDEFESQLRTMEQQAEQSGERTGNKLGSAMSTGLKVAAGAAAALGLAVAGAVPAMQELAAEADKTRASHEMFLKTLERTGTDSGKATAAVAELADKLKVAPAVIEEGMTLILRAGGSLESATRGLLAAGASAAASGADIGKAVENAAVGLAMGRSEMMEYAGIVVNASDAHKAYAKELGTTVEKLTEAQKIEAYSKAVYKESAMEVQDLSVVMGGLAGQQADAAKRSQELRQVIGEAVLPIVKALGGVMGEAQNQLIGWVKSLDKEQIAAFAGQIKGMADIVRGVVVGAFNVAGPIVQTFGGVVLNVANTAAPVLKAALGTIASQVVPLLVTGFNAAGAVLSGVSAGFQKLSAFVERNKELLIPLAAGIGTVVGALAIHRAAVVAATAVTSAWTAATTAATTASVALRAAIAFITGPVGIAVAAITGLVAAGVYLYRNWDEVKAKAVAIWGSLKQIIANAINGVVAFLRGIDLKEIGLDIVRGLANGILAGPRLVLAAAQGLGAAVINGVKGALKIKSPSVVMFEAGEDAGRGLVLGLQKTTPDVQRAAALMGTAVYQGVVDTLAAGLVEIQNAAKQVDVVRSLFGEGEKGLANALAYYGVRTFEELSERAPQAARLVEAAYRDIITAQRAAAQAEADYAAALEEGTRAGNAALATLDQVVLGGRDLAAGAQPLRDTSAAFVELMDRLVELRGELSTPGVAEAWTASIEELGRRGELTAAQVAALTAQIKDLQALANDGPLLPDNLQGRGIPDGTVVGPDDPATGALAPGEYDALLAAALEIDPDDLRAALAAMESAGRGATELAGVYRDALAQIDAANAEALSSIAAGVDELGNTVYLTEDQIRGIGVASDEVSESFFDLENAAKTAITLTREELESLIATAGLTQEQADYLRAAWVKNQQEMAEKTRQAQEKARRAVEDTINSWASYAQRLIPVVQGAMEALGGATSEVAEQWAQDLSSMTSDLASFATAIARGDYVGAAIQALTTIFNWFSRNKRAAEEAARATAEYNKQFRFAQGTAGDNYGTRTVSKYTTGFLFWSTDHYKEQIDQLKRDLALSVEGGFANGIQDGFSQALAQNDFSLFEKSLKSSVGKAVLDGLVESFINQAVLARIIGPAIDSYLQTGDTAALQAAIRGASGEAQRFYNEVLAPIAREFGLLGTGTSASSSAPESTIRNVRVEAPSITASINLDVLGTLASVIERAAPRIETGGQALLEGSSRWLAGLDRLERLLTHMEMKPNGSYR